MQKPRVARTTMRPPTAMPILAESVSPPDDGLKLPTGMGVVILTDVSVNTEPWIEIVVPSTGC
jgi:hypothetical protein